MRPAINATSLFAPAGALGPLAGAASVKAERSAARVRVYGIVVGTRNACDVRPYIAGSWPLPEHVAIVDRRDESRVPRNPA